MEDQLLNNFITAEYEYCKFLEIEWQQRFKKDTLGFVFDTNHWGYKFLEVKEIKNECPECRIIYKKLAPLCHPDKNLGNHELFIELSTAYNENNLQKLVEMNQKLCNDTFVQSPPSNSLEIKKKYISSVKKTLWYLWYSDEGMSSFIKQVLVSKEEIDKRNSEAKISSEN